LIAQLAHALEMNVPKTMEMALKINKDKVVAKYQKALSKYLDGLATSKARVSDGLKYE